MAASGHQAFGTQANVAVQGLLERRQWRSSLIGRILTLGGLQWDLWRTLRALRRQGAAAGIASAPLMALLSAAREAHAATVAVAHLEDLRALLGTWRWLHRWLAVLMLLLLVVHVVIAVLHGAFVGGGVP